MLKSRLVAEVAQKVGELNTLLAQAARASVEVRVREEHYQTIGAPVAQTVLHVRLFEALS